MPPLTRELVVECGDSDQLAEVRAATLVDSSIDDLSQIRTCPELHALRTLSLSRNQISDIDPLSHLTGLKSLSLSFNCISSIDGLQSCTQLTTLMLSNNRIEDVTPLARLHQLHELSLHKNAICNTDLTLAVLKPIRRLTCLDLLANPCAAHPTYPQKILQHLTQLLQLDGDRTIRSSSTSPPCDHPPRPDAGDVRGTGACASSPTTCDESEPLAGTEARPLTPVAKPLFQEAALNENAVLTGYLADMAIEDSIANSADDRTARKGRARSSFVSRLRSEATQMAGKASPSTGDVQVRFRQPLPCSQAGRHRMTARWSCNTIHSTSLRALCLLCSQLVYNTWPVLVSSSLCCRQVYPEHHSACRKTTGFDHRCHCQAVN